MLIVATAEKHVQFWANFFRAIWKDLWIKMGGKCSIESIEPSIDLAGHAVFSLFSVKRKFVWSCSRVLSIPSGFLLDEGMRSMIIDRY